MRRGAATTIDERVARRAERQHGLVTRGQALAIGLTDRQIERRVGDGRWERLHPGVYRIVGAPATDAQRALAAVLAGPAGSLVCGLTSLALLGVGAAPRVPSICVEPSQSARTRGSTTRRSPIAPMDRTLIGPIPATAPARALLEAAPLVPDAVLRDLLDDVICRDLASPSAIAGAVRRAATGRGRSGAPRVLAALQPWLEGVAFDSPAEARLLRRITGWGFPTPVRQHPVRLPDGAVVHIDVAWPSQRVGLEYDGKRWHTPRRLGHDEARDAALASLGWWIGRVGRHDLAPSSTRVRDELQPRLRPMAA